jgi:hypothetical protein
MMRIFRRAHGVESSGQIRYQVVGIFRAHVKADQGDSCTAASTKSIRSPCRHGIPHAVAPDVQRDEFSPLIRSPHALPADLATDDIAEQFPTLALEFPELKLLDRSEVSCAGVERDAGQEPFQLQSKLANSVWSALPVSFRLKFPWWPPSLVIAPLK